MAGETQQPRYQAIYRACIKEAAAQGPALIQAALARALAELPQRAAATPDLVERNLLREAVEVLGEHQQRLAAAFPQALLAEFSHAIAGDRASALSFESLQLLAEDQLQENVDLVRASNELEAAVRPQLDAFELALRDAQLASPANPQRHPLRPEVYARSVYRVARQSPVPPSVRHRWVRHLPPLMAPELVRTYAALAGRIAPQPAAAGEAMDPAQVALAQSTQLTIRELRKLLAGEPGAPAEQAVMVFAESEFSHTVPAALEMVQDMRKVDQLMLQLRQRQAAMPASGRDSIASFRDALRKEAKRPAQALGLEVVHLMLASLAADSRLLQPVRDVVRELEPPLLRLALEDPRFFSDRDHPARRMLEEVTQRSLAWGSADEPGFPGFMDALQQATEALLDTRTAGAETFRIALEVLQEAWDDAQPRGRRNRERAVRALMRAEQRNLLAERIGRQILERADAAAAPPEALAFLSGPWAQVMAQARLSDTTGAEDPGGFGWVVGTVLASVQPLLAARVAGQQDALTRRITTGLAGIDHLPADTQRWLRLLAALRDLALSSATGMAVRASEPEPAPQKVDTWLAPLEMHESGYVPEQALAAAPAPSDADLLPIAELAVGSFVDLAGEGWERWQLTWSSPHGLLFMFTHAGGATRSMTRRKLHQMMSEGQLRLVSTQPVVDGALDAVARAAWRNSL